MFFFFPPLFFSLDLIFPHPTFSSHGSPSPSHGAHSRNPPPPPSSDSGRTMKREEKVVYIEALV